jgi:hypothetical protein
LVFAGIDLSQELNAPLKLGLLRRNIPVLDCFAVVALPQGLPSPGGLACQSKCAAHRFSPPPHPMVD